MLLKDLRWEWDNPPGYPLDRFISQWMFHPGFANGGHNFDTSLFQERDFFELDSRYQHNFFRVIKRVEPHVRAGKYSVRCYTAYQSPKIQREIVYFEGDLEIACFISPLLQVPTPKPWWRKLLHL
jgi:hypothetical protein